MGDKPDEVKRRIHEAVVKSYALRDESNELLAQAQKLLADALDLPELGRLARSGPDEAGPSPWERELQTRSAAGGPPAPPAPLAFTVRLSELHERLDCSYHLPIVRTIISHEDAGRGVAGA